MADKFTFSSAGQVHELEMSLDRVGGWTNALIKTACGGDHLGRFRDVLLGRAEIVSVAIQPPEGGRIYTLSISVDGKRDWRSAVAAVGPNTGRDWDIWKVDDQYPVEESGFREIILANFGSGSLTTGPKAVAWGKAHGLRPETPRTIFAVAEFRPLFHRELGIGLMEIVSLLSCSFEGNERAPFALLYDTRRFASLDWFKDDWGDHCWFAFGRE